MKRKILTIALSLALLTSLFVFASPVSAKPAEQSGHFDFWLESSTIPGQGWNVDYYRFVGNGEISHFKAWRMYAIDTSLGSGTGVLYYTSNWNRVIGKRHGKGVFVLDLPGGTITWNRLSMTDTVTGDHHVKIILLDATGDYEGLHFSAVRFEDPPEGEPWEFLAHWAPKQ